MNLRLASGRPGPLLHRGRRPSSLLRPKWLPMLRDRPPPSPTRPATNRVAVVAAVGAGAAAVGETAARMEEPWRIRGMPRASRAMVATSMKSGINAAPIGPRPVV